MQQKTALIYFIAGENSGDFIGSQIIKQLLENNIVTAHQIAGIGGPLMQKTGLKSLFAIEEINMMGFAEILPHILRLKRLIQLTITDILRQQPKILVTIDSPGFTYRVAQAIKQQAPEIRLVHVVAPSVWAYKEHRAQKYAKLYDQLLTLFDFEVAYFTKYNLPTLCMGHPIFEQQFFAKPTAATSVKTITITPGSRRKEVIRHLPIIIEAAQQINQAQPIKLLIVQANEQHLDLIQNLCSQVEFKWEVTTKRLQAFAKGDVAIAKSGTNVLEIAASATPAVVVYKLNYLSYLIIRSMIKLKFVSIINIIAGKAVIPELLQNDFSADQLAATILRLLNDSEYATNQVRTAQGLLANIGLNSKEVPSLKAAKVLAKLL